MKDLDDYRVGDIRGTKIDILQDRIWDLLTHEHRNKRQGIFIQERRRKDKRLNTPEFNRKVKKRRIKAKAAKQARKRNWGKK